MFTEKKLTLSFTYGTGERGDGEATTATITGVKASMFVNIIGGYGLAQCTGRIYGMGLSLMNQLSKVGRQPMQFRNNILTVLAGDDVSGMAQIFQGNVVIAFPDMLSAPEVSFMVTAYAGFLEQLKPAPINSYPGSVDAAVILSNLASQMNVKFENNGVSVILPSSYYYGSAREQAKKVVHDAGIEWNGIDNGVMAIWPKGGTRQGSIPLINTKNGMIGYPSFTENGIFVKTIFNPTIRFGQLVKVESDIDRAYNQWKVSNLVHHVEAKTPGGAWQTEMQLVLPGVFGQ